MNNEWEKIYKKNSFREKNKWPNEDLISFIMRKYGNTKNKNKINILELGCGWGNNLRLLKDLNFNYFGIDQSKTATNYCKKYYKNIFCCNFSEIPFGDQFFDIVLDRQSIQHNDKFSINNIFSEIHRILKKRGLLYSHLISKSSYKVKTHHFKVNEIKKFLKNFSSLEITKKTEKKIFDKHSKNLQEMYIVVAKK